MKETARVVEKLILTGTLQLESPLLIGSGQEDEAKTHEVDTYVLKNNENIPFIPGTSLAGVLRHLLPTQTARILFGYTTPGVTEDTLQSAVAVADIPLRGYEIISRDGVSLDPFTKTGKQGGKYNYEAVERGATGMLQICITLRQYHLDTLPTVHAEIQHIADLLAAGSIRLGALTAKGFGRISCADSTVMTYDFTKPEQVKQWLLDLPSETIYRGKKKNGLVPGSFVMEGDFALKTSLLVRSTLISDAEREDKIHAVPLKSGTDYVIPGTSLKGVLRHQAAYILRTLNKPVTLLDTVMGSSSPDEKRKSRFITDEVYFHDGVVEAKQTRNGIDRFTGSTMDSKLFAEKPVWQQQQGVPVLHLRLTIEQCQDWEAGLALCLFKDLWNGRLALGGDAAVGRGYVTGVRASITRTDTDGVRQQWQFDTEGLQSGEADVLNRFVTTFVSMEGEHA